MRQQHAAMVEALRTSHEAKLALLNEDLRKEVVLAKAELDALTDEKISAQASVGA